MPSITTIDNLGYVLDEDIQVINNISQFSLPASSTASTQIANFSGKKRLVVLTCIHTGEGYAGATTKLKLKAFVTDMENWNNSGTQTSRIYSDELGFTYNVLCLDFKRNFTIKSTGQIVYTLVLLEGTLLGA